MRYIDKSLEVSEKEFRIKIRRSQKEANLEHRFIKWLQYINSNISTDRHVYIKRLRMTGILTRLSYIKDSGYICTVWLSMKSKNGQSVDATAIFDSNELKRSD